MVETERRGILWAVKPPQPKVAADGGGDLQRQRSVLRLDATLLIHATEAGDRKNRFVKGEANRDRERQRETETERDRERQRERKCDIPASLSTTPGLRVLL